jgi:hypothetical protein
VALAEATQQAAHGKARYREQSGEVEAETSGEAPRSLGGPLDPNDTGRATRPSGARGQQPAAGARGGRASGRAGGFGGRLVGLVGLVVAAVLLRGRTVPDGQQQVSRA